MNEGDHETAILQLKQALAENPGDAVVHNRFGSALAATGHLADAVAQYRRATTLSPEYPDAHNSLATALLQSGRLTEAIASTRRALEIASRAGDEGLVRDLRQRRSTYEAAARGGEHAPTKVSSR